ncbi:MAG: 50S ribosomal protein L32 [bacterium]|nr:50S ribosomal protein L32 [bacterium]
MPVPARRKTASSRRERTRHLALKPVNMTTCSACHAPRRPHHECSACGKK